MGFGKIINTLMKILRKLFHCLSGDCLNGGRECEQSNGDKYILVALKMASTMEKVFLPQKMERATMGNT